MKRKKAPMGTNRVFINVVGGGSVFEGKGEQVHNAKHESIDELTYAEGTERVEPSRDTEP